RIIGVFAVVGGAEQTARCVVGGGARRGADHGRGRDGAADAAAGPAGGACRAGRGGVGGTGAGRVVTGYDPQSRNSSCWGVRGFTSDRKSTRLNSSHVSISYAVFCLK